VERYVGYRSADDLEKEVRTVSHYKRREENRSPENIRRSVQIVRLKERGRMGKERRGSEGKGRKRREDRIEVRKGKRGQKRIG
jgi:hypothetical protein